MKRFTISKKNLSFFVFLLCMMAFRWSFADQYVVPSGSMEPTIQVGDHVFVHKSAYQIKIPFTNLIALKTADPQRGEVVVFSHPDSGICMVKRLIGVPGDDVEIRDGFVFINGEPLPGTQEGWRVLQSAGKEEVFYTEQIGAHQASIKRTPSFSRAQHLHFVVPPDEYFMMGDNRDNSLDSRSWGFAKRQDLRGRAIGVLANFHLDENWIPTADLRRIAKIFE